MELVELPGDHDELERGQLIDGEADVYELANFVLPPGRAKDRRFVLREDGRPIASAGILTAAVAIDEHAFSVVGTPCPSRGHWFWSDAWPRKNTQQSPRRKRASVGPQTKRVAAKGKGGAFQGLPPSASQPDFIPPSNRRKA